MSSLLARYLKDFGEPQAHHAAPQLPDFGETAPLAADAPDFADFPQPEAPDPDLIRQEAYAEGYETASAELGVRHAEEMEALRQAHAEELAAIRQSLERDAATAISEGLKNIAHTVADRISEELALCLAPVLQEEIARKSVTAMAGMVREAILEGEAGAIIVKGPLSLFNILATELGEDASLLRHVEAADLDLSVEMAGSVLVTRMSAFAASLKKVLE
ncbi:hypothetical protein [Gellertiella hungarica]|uniref:DNA primase large subunit n=1 Tax=Gellertiella hungarica TaxID=1572859 RepID=A0A7W6J586_9HYPH|nr:hypothetical protein [Gellertiella hungarica]MBB4064131.1 DNA primase large subunit [Gellertiella hungarica]